MKEIKLPCTVEPFDGRIVDSEENEIDSGEVLIRVNTHDRLVEALTLLLHEVVESGNYNADDFGWPTAVSKSNAIRQELEQGQ